MREALPTSQSLTRRIMFRTLRLRSVQATLITTLLLSGTFAFSQSVGNWEDQRLPDKRTAVESPASTVPDWADSQLPEDPRAAEAPQESFSPPDPPADPPPVPIDGGLGLLALAGAGFAANKLRNRKKK